MPERRYPASEVRGGDREEIPQALKSEARGGGREELPHAPKPEARGSGREELHHVPMLQDRGGSREEQPHFQGVVAVLVLEGLAIPCSRSEGEVVRRYPSSKVRSNGCNLLEQP